MIPLSLIYGFSLALARVSGIFIFVPIPGIKAGPSLIRAVFSLCCTFTLFPAWSRTVVDEPSAGRLIGWLLADAALGILIGLTVAVVTESFLMGAQIVSLQAGYGFATFFDPNTEADSTVLVQIAQTLAGFLFFVIGLDRQIIAIFARSFEVYPPGAFELHRSTAEVIIALASNIFSMGLRLVLPIVALLAIVDLVLAILGRLNAQLQLITLSFPVKMLVSLAMLAWIVRLYPKLFTESAAITTGMLHKLLAL